MLHRAGLSTRDEFLALALGQDRSTADHARASRAVDRERVVRRVDQALSTGRELTQHVDQLLREGRGRRVSARPQDPSRHERPAQPGRCDEGGVSDVLGRARIRRSRSSARSSRRLQASASSRSVVRAGWNRRTRLHGCARHRLASGSRRQNRSREDAAAARRLGAATKIDGGRLVVSQVRRGTPAHEAGINVDDEIIAIDDFRVRPDQLEARMEQYVVGDRVSLLVARRDRLDSPRCAHSEPNR